MEIPADSEFDRLPRTIWMYWDQGEAQAPFLVRHCIGSWRRENPDWELRLLDRSSWASFPGLDWVTGRADIGLQHRSDLLRLHLLTTAGGVWADATLFCNRPLDDWLPAAWQQGFFAFSSIKRDREISNWFLAGTPGSALLLAWRDAVFDFWRRHRFPPQRYWRRQLARKIMSLRKRDLIGNDVWFGRLLPERLGVYPYPVNMYLFDWVLARSTALASAWQEREKWSDRDCEHLQNPLGIHSPVTPESRDFLTRSPAPMYKLNWRQDRGCAMPGSNLAFLLELKGMR